MTRPRAAEFAAPTDGDIGLMARRPSALQIALWSASVLYAVVWCVSHWGTYQIGVLMDDASYAVLARSLLHGPHYGLINVPYGADPTRYPCGLPLLLVPLTLAFPSSLAALSLLPIVSTLGVSALLFWGWPGFSRRGSYWWGLAVSALYLLTPPTLNGMYMVMSEPEFTLASLGALWLTGRVAAGRAGWGTILAWGALLMAAVLIRTVGVVLLLTALAYVVVVQRRAAAKTLALGLVGMAAVVGLLLTTDVRPADLLPGEYVHQFNDPSAFGQRQAAGPLGARALSALGEYALTDLRQTILPLGGGPTEGAVWQRYHLPDLTPALGLLFTLVLVAGLWRGLVRDGLSVFWLYALLSFAALLVWPWRGPRFLIPIQPQMYFAWLLGLEGLVVGLAGALRAREPARATALGVAGVAAAVLALGGIGHGGRTLYDTRVHAGDFSLVTAWTRSHAPRGAVLLSEQPQRDYLYGDRRTLPFTAVPTRSDLSRLVTAHQIDYILIAPALDWRPQFVPRHSARTQQIEGWLRGPGLKHQVSLAYTLPRDGLSVYRVSP